MASRFNHELFLKKLNEIEGLFPVNDWRVNDLQIWPFLRTAIAYSQNRNPNTKNKIAPPRKLHKRIVGDLRIALSLLRQFSTVRRRLVDAKRLFFGTISHRSRIGNIWINKYFDMAVLDLRSAGEGAVVFEGTRDLDRNQLCNSESVYSLYSLYILTELTRVIWRRDEVAVSTPGYDEFYSYLLKSLDHPEIIKKNFKKSDVAKRAVSLYRRKEFVKRLLNKSPVESVYVLCYYSATLYPVIAACNELGIPTVDIQHGGIGPGHFSYDNWSQVPASGYSLLPKYFWSWDSNSAALINKWAAKTSFHRAITNGNPWHHDALRVFKKRPDVSGYILFSMNEGTLDNFVVETIRYYGARHMWVLRLHPRMIHNRPALEEQLKREGITDLVVIEDSNLVPLIVSIRSARLFLSKASGSVIEAVELGYKPVLLRSPNVSYHKHYIDDEKVFFLEEDSMECLVRQIDATPAFEDRGGGHIAESSVEPYLNFESAVRTFLKGV